jgi:hypothetical protein
LDLELGNSPDSTFTVKFLSITSALLNIDIFE